MLISRGLLQEQKQAYHSLVAGGESKSDGYEGSESQNRTWPSLFSSIYRTLEDWEDHVIQSKTPQQGTKWPLEVVLCWTLYNVRNSDKWKLWTSADEDHVIQSKAPEQARKWTLSQDRFQFELWLVTLTTTSFFPHNYNEGVNLLHILLLIYFSKYLKWSDDVLWWKGFW